MDFGLKVAAEPDCRECFAASTKSEPLVALVSDYTDYPSLQHIEGESKRT